MARLGLGGRHSIFDRRRTPSESKAARLHALLDKVLDEGVTAVEVESDLVDLLSLARRRRARDDLPTGGQ